MNLAIEIVSGALVAAAAILLLPALVLLMQTLGYLLGLIGFGRAVPLTKAARHARVAVIMPAHNEATVIAETVRALLPQLHEGDRLLVVADNCTDHTAIVARAAGASVTERQNEHLRGKGFALDWGLKMLASDPPDVVAVVDADCEVASGSLDALARDCMLHNRPVQGRNVMKLPANASLKLRIAAFAWMLKTEIRPFGCHNLGLPCQLMGTGMALPWSLIAAAKIASGNLVEDMQLGIDLAVAGKPPRFCPESQVTSWFPMSDAAGQTQRTRWEHGLLSTMRRQLPRIVGEAVRQRRPDLAAVALDFCVPPLALLVLALTGVLSLEFAWWFLTDRAMGLCVALVALGTVAFCVGVAWLTLGRQILSLGQLLGIPIYIVGKVPMYLQWVFGRRPSSWVRTERDKHH